MTSTAAGGYGQPAAVNMYAGTGAPTNTISYAGTSAPTNTIGYAGTTAATNTISTSNPFANILAGGATGAVSAGAGATGATGVPNLFSTGGNFQFFTPGAPEKPLPDVQPQLASPP